MAYFPQERKKQGQDKKKKKRDTLRLVQMWDKSAKKNK